MHEQLQRAYHVQRSGAPAIVIRLIDDDLQVVDLSSGYNDFQAHVARANSPETNLLTITGVTGTASGFVVPTVGLNSLTADRAYIVTASAIEIATGQPRSAQAEIYIRPAPPRT